MVSLAHVSFSGAPALVPPRRCVVRSGRGNRTDAVCDVDPLVTAVLRGNGIDPARYRSSALQRRAATCRRALADDLSGGNSSARSASLSPSTLSAVLIGVTEFFRDRAVFEALRTEVIPQFLNEKQAVSVCSIGCSSGQELYSFAWCLAELSAPTLQRAKFIGLDCRVDAIQRAQSGLFTEAELVGLPQPWDHCFQRNADGWRVRSDLRSRMQWRAIDLFAEGAIPPATVMLFRNVAIYLNDAAAADAWSRIAAQLSVGAILVTGRAEKPPTALGLIQVAPCIYRKVST